jgi:transposase
LSAVVVIKAFHRLRRSRISPDRADDTAAAAAAQRRNTGL